MTGSPVITAGNLFAAIPETAAAEEVSALLAAPGTRIERIVSFGQESPPGFWYDQDWAEWVILLSGSARLRFVGEDEARDLAPGDYVHIPPHARHRVEATDANGPTIWLAVHYREPD